MKARGFTLIELLVVVAIIGVLAAIVISSLSSAREKARDAARKTDLRSIRNALETYYIDNGHYPVIPRWALSSGNSRWSQFETQMNPYISLPKDPKNTGASGPWSNGSFVYAYSSQNGQIYDLMAQVENQNDDLACRQTCNKYHQGEGTYPPGTYWCNVCPGGAHWSPYIITDH